MFQVSNLSFHYPNGTKIFEDLSLSLNSLGLCYLEGKNGSGKTTFLRLLGQLALPQKGQINFQNNPLMAGMVSYMPSNPDSSFFHLTGEETLNLFSSLNQQDWKSQKWSQIALSSETFSKALKTKFFECSTGMKQFINFGRTLSKNTDIILLDEPLNGIDKENRSFFLSMIKELSQEKLVFLTSHHHPDVTIDHHLILNEGVLTYA